MPRQTPEVQHQYRLFHTLRYATVTRQARPWVTARHHTSLTCAPLLDRYLGGRRCFGRVTR